MPKWSSIALLLVLVLEQAQGALQRVESDEAFEDVIMSNPHAVAVLFNSASKGEDAAAAERLVEKLSMKMSAVQFFHADVDSVRAFASEFNVRKRLVPRMLIFASRARQADLIPM